MRGRVEDWVEGGIEGRVEGGVEGGGERRQGGESGEWSTECSVLSTEGDLRQRVRGRGRDRNGRVDRLISWPVGQLAGERHGPAGTLVPTGANGIRERLGVSGWRLG